MGGTERITAAVTLVAPAVGALEALGRSPSAVLGAAGIARDAIEVTGDRVPYDRVLRAWEEAARVAGDGAFGLHVGAHLPKGGLDLMDYLLCTSPTIVEAYRRVAKYARFLYDGIWFRVEATDRILKVVRSRKEDAGDGARQFREFMVAATVHRTREGARVEWKPQRIFFGHSRHDASGEAERFFGCPVEYDHRSDQIWLSPATGDLPLHSFDSKLSAILQRYADSVVAKLPSRGHFVASAHSAIAHELAKGHISVARSAGHLGMSPRTFQRKLKAHATSHRKLLDDTQYDLARAYLSDAGVSITEIAFLLHFADVSAFTRAFKRWSGQTPSAFRSAQVGAAE